MKIVATHRKCQGCGYDLFSIAADARCTECNRRVGGTRRARKPKNPKRVAAQLRRMIEDSHRHRVVLVMLWLVPLMGIGACWWFRAGWLIWTVAGMGFVSGVIQHLVELTKRADWEKELAAIEKQQQSLGH